MTIYYQGDFWKLLISWKGSIWKAVWKEYCMFISLYALLSILYRYAMSENVKLNFNIVILAFNNYLKYIPITFLLGFYVSSMVGRWWAQFQSLAWPDDIAAFVNLVVRGNEPEDIKRRRAAARYLVASCILAWRDMSTRVRKRFPTMQHVVEANVLTQNEIGLIQSSPAAHWLLPIDWLQRIGELQLKESKVPPPIVGAFTGALNGYRNKFRVQHSYDWVTVPLIYTQVAALATYSYFIFSIIGMQYIDPAHKVKGYELDLYFPFCTTLQFLFYVGWLKVGQDIMRPFGEDDDDFEMNYIIDRHARAAMAIVDTHHSLTPNLMELEDPLDGGPLELPHTLVSKKLNERIPMVQTGQEIKYDKEKFVFIPLDDQTKNDRSSRKSSMFKKNSVAPGEEPDELSSRRPLGI